MSALSIPALRRLVIFPKTHRRAININRNYQPVSHSCQFSVATSSPTSRAGGLLGKSIDLPDGRQLGYHEFGDPNGKTIIYIHGSPDSGVTLSGFEDSLARRLGIRWVAPDRPGIGQSTFQPGRRVVDYPDDLSCLIQHLGLRRYRLLGTSGGTGYTLACARIFPREELLAVGICAGIGPHEAGLAGQSEEVQAVMGYWIDHSSTMVSLMESIFLAAARNDDPAAMEATWRQQLEKSFNADDREVLTKPDAIQSAVKVFRQVHSQGGAGHGHEMKLVLEPWGFDLEEVGYDGIFLWYGSNDANTPPEMGRYMAERLPGAIYKEYSGKTHYSIWSEQLLSEFIQDLLRSNSAQPPTAS
ncbi:hypothetical protein NLG97_g837 [Lecanicillium saksenae]|uniref:Uncharacterized protein n=1 Tax=Lecanicillium saksenae TaxID=468837 RepID=A0ACC1R8V9_9HYPO|nr:hypothetical protein NLG97_g837 [Lecanicillium saksenae]